MTLKGVLKALAPKDWLSAVIGGLLALVLVLWLVYDGSKSEDPWYAPTYYDNPPAKSGGGDSYYPDGGQDNKGGDLYAPDDNGGKGYTFYPAERYGYEPDPTAPKKSAK
jgi:hypothetical protein